MIWEMSFKCLFDSIAKKHIQKANQKIMVEHFFKNIQQLFIFSKKAPKQMFEWVLNISLVSVKNKQTSYLT